MYIDKISVTKRFTIKLEDSEFIIYGVFQTSLGLRILNSLENMNSKKATKKKSITITTNQAKIGRKKIRRLS